MKEITPNQAIMKHDIFRYKKNKLSSSLALLGIVLNCLYFCLVYGITTTFEPGTTDYTMFVSLEIGVSVILNLLVLLFGFFGSEGIKAYNKKFSILLIVLAVVQIVRIFILPLYGYRNNLLTVTYFGYNPTNSTVEFIIMIIYLCASAACFAASAIFGYLRATSLEKHLKAVESGEINIQATIAEIENEEAQKAETKTTTEEVQNA